MQRDHTQFTPSGGQTPSGSQKVHVTTWNPLPETTSSTTLRMTSPPILGAEATPVIKVIEDLRRDLEYIKTDRAQVLQAEYELDDQLNSFNSRYKHGFFDERMWREGMGRFRHNLSKIQLKKQMLDSVVSNKLFVLHNYLAQVRSLSPPCILTPPLTPKSPPRADTIEAMDDFDSKEKVLKEIKSEPTTMKLKKTDSVYIDLTEETDDEDEINKQSNEETIDKHSNKDAINKQPNEEAIDRIINNYMGNEYVFVPAKLPELMEDLGEVKFPSASFDKIVADVESQQGIKVKKQLQQSFVKVEPSECNLVSNMELDSEENIDADYVQSNPSKPIFDVSSPSKDQRQSVSEDETIPYIDECSLASQFPASPSFPLMVRDHREMISTKKHKTFTAATTPSLIRKTNKFTAVAPSLTRKSNACTATASTSKGNFYTKTSSCPASKDKTYNAKASTSKANTYTTTPYSSASKISNARSKPTAPVISNKTPKRAYYQELYLANKIIDMKKKKRSTMMKKTHMAKRTHPLHSELVPLGGAGKSTSSLNFTCYEKQQQQRQQRNQRHHHSTATPTKSLAKRTPVTSSLPRQQHKTSSGSSAPTPAAPTASSPSKDFERNFFEVFEMEFNE